MALLQSCSLLGTDHPQRFAITVETRVANQTRIGRGVIQIDYNIQPDVLARMDDFDSSPLIEGYAITVDLGSRGLLLLTFRDVDRTPSQQVERNGVTNCILSDIACLPLAAYDVRFGNLSEGSHYAPYSAEERVIAALRIKHGKRPVPVPVLTDFAYIPEPAKRSKPAFVSPFDLSELPPDLQVVRVDIEATTDPVSPEPVSWPAWLVSFTRDGTFRGVKP